MSQSLWGIDLLYLTGMMMCYRKLYWTDQGTDSGVPAKVASANMDGTGIETLFTGNLDHVEFITIDIKEQKLYWAVTSTGVVGDNFLIVALLLLIYLWVYDYQV